MVIIITMKIELRQNAYAKINIGLQVFPERGDGFHNLQSIFQTVGLYDELIVAYDSDSREGFKVECDSMILPAQNTLVTAFDAFCSVTGRELRGISVKLIKRIPSGGGLGGGSSDGAALVKALEKITETQLSENQLNQIASKVGSDVFFFTKCDENGKGCALVSGRGEFVETISSRKDLYFILVFPDVFSSTKEAYQLVDDQLSSGQSIDFPEFNRYETMYNGSVVKWKFANSFTPALVKRYPKIGRVLDCIRTSGAVYAEMSGSGSTCFGVYSSKEEVENAGRYIVQSGFKCVVVSD